MSPPQQPTGDPADRYGPPGPSSYPPPAPQGLSAYPPPTPPPSRSTGTGLLIAGLVACTMLLVAGVAVVSWPTLREAISSGGSALTDYRDREDLLKPKHRTGRIDYEITPPVGGPHHPTWQNCQGRVYDEPIADEHAVHSLEHGAVWITYRPGLTPGQVKTLAKKVRGVDRMMMSPYRGLDTPISVQAWGLQLKTGRADDKAIIEFIREHRGNGPEPSGTCDGGVTATGSKPRQAGSDHHN